MNWRFDIDQAPRSVYTVDRRRIGKTDKDIKVLDPVRVLLATKCGKVTASHYIPDEDRWQMLAKGEQPIAWQLWPSHPQHEAAK